MIRFVYFDAVGTLLIPHPSVSEIYLEVGRRFGTRQNLEGLRLKVRAAFQRQESLDATLGWSTSESREVERWRSIVSDSLDDVAAPENCFQELYRFFSQPEAWRLDERLESWQSLLSQRGIGMGIASNFDVRLRRLMDWFPSLKRFSPVMISSESGWRKPSDHFYSLALKRCGHPAEEVLFVGDHPHYDVEMPRRHGMKSLAIGDFAADPTRALGFTPVSDDIMRQGGTGGSIRLTALSSQ